MELMMLHGIHLQMSTLLSIILLRIFLERWKKYIILEELVLTHNSNLISIVKKVQAQCKIALQKELGLPVRPDCPLVRCSLLSTRM